MSNVVYDIARVEACTDCVIISENDDASGMTTAQYAEWHRGMMRTAGPLMSEGWFWAGVQCDDWDGSDDDGCRDHDEECPRDGWFSWSPCEWCGSTLGGQRYNAAIMKRLH